MSKVKHAILKQVGDKLFVDVWMEPKPDIDTSKNTNVFNLSNWLDSAQTIEVHPTMKEAFIELATTIYYILNNCEGVAKMLESGIEIPCENIKIRNVPENYDDESSILTYAFLHQEKEEKPSESTKQTEIEIIDKFLRAMNMKDFKKWDSYQITTEQLYKKYFPTNQPLIP